MIYAHSRNASGVRHGLREHLESVAEAAAAHAAAFHGSAFARAAGLLHDVGKASPAFQHYLAACEAKPTRRHPTVDHKGAGSLAALGSCDELAFLIDGHHGGLPDRAGLRTRTKELRSRAATLDSLAVADELELIPHGTLSETQIFPAYALENALSHEVFLRMAFSALVDADHLDTERHFNPEQFTRRGAGPELDVLAERLHAAQQALSGLRDDPVNRIRDEVYRDCLNAAPQEPGFFRLTVPTGGGKTRSGLAFALEHALIHQMRRVVVAVPYLTITDQTAEVYRAVLGDDRAVLEHHSGATAREDAEGSMRPEAIWRRLAAQNWDAPVIVTTTVQLFESAFGRTPSACRKLHRLARSVIVLDEAQALPPPLLAPILSVLQELVTNYGTTVVLCTATQPALAKAPGFEHLSNVREIVPEPTRHFRSLERVRYEWPAIEKPWDWPDVAEAMRSERQALAIVNTKAHALDLLEALDDPDALHLSTLLCGAHRRDVLAVMRRRLGRGEACRVVSTQVVEAGVDIDFPVVLRALGPLDHIVQAAGRCNREGLLERGRVVIFRPDDEITPPGHYRTASNVTDVLLRAGVPDMNDPALFERYFGSLYPVLNLDAKGINRLREQFAYERVADEFRLIDDDTVPVIVPYAGLGHDPAAVDAHPVVDHRQRVRELLNDLERDPTAGGFGLARSLFERAQPYVVSLRRHHARQAEAQGLTSELRAGLWRWNGGYDNVRGLVAPRNPEEFVV